MKTKDLIAEAISLPVEERAVVVESILNSLNPPDPIVEKKWISVAKRRLSDLNSGAVEAVPGDEVFNRIWDRLSS
jgi:putative addiction module component (TIGR02574 family)